MTSATGNLRFVATDTAPRAIGPYSQAVVAGPFVFTAGQIPLDPVTMDVVGGTIGEQTERVLRNIAAILEAAGASLDRVVKTTVYLADMGDFAGMNEVYARVFGAHRPARSTVAAKALPKNVLVEVDAIAVLSGGGSGLVV